MTLSPARRRKKKLAIFDIDGTIFRSSLGIEAFHALVDAGIFPKRAKRELEKDYRAWLNRRGTYENYVRRIIILFLKNIPGAREAEVKRVVDVVIHEHKDRVYRFTRDLIKKLKKKKYTLLAISGSPSYIVDPFAHYLGFDYYYASVHEVKRGRFTGSARDMGSPLNKKEQLALFLKQHPGEFDMAKSIGVGDTVSDAPLLAAVGQPIAFNPNMELARLAKKRGWRIVVERKDVIYEVQKAKFIKI